MPVGAPPPVASVVRFALAAETSSRAPKARLMALVLVKVLALLMVSVPALIVVAPL